MFLLLFLYLLKVLLDIRRRLLKPVLIMWVMFTLVVVFSILSIFLFLYPSNNNPCIWFKLDSNTEISRVDFQVVGYFRLTILQLSYLYFCFIYYEVMIKFESLYFVTTEDFYIKKKNRRMIVVILILVIVLANALYRVFWLSTND